MAKRTVAAADRIYTAIRDDIIHNKYKGGSFLVESQLSDEFNVSRTPVREALIRLSQDGFIEMIPNKGAFIPHITIIDITALCEIRAANEGMAAYLCAKDRSPALISLLEQSIEHEQALLDAGASPTDVSLADFQFHALLAKGCHSPKIEKQLGIIHNQMERLVKSSADETASATTLRKSLEYHKKVMEAIREENPLGAFSAIVDHWMAMQNGYIERDLIGKLNPNL